MPVDHTVSRRHPRRRPPRRPRVLAMLSSASLALGFAGVAPLAARPPQPAAGSGEAAGEVAPESAGPSRDAASFDDPFDAYEAQAWEEALEGFLDRRAQRPEDPAELLNVGSTHYQLGEYEQALRAFRAAAAGDAGPGSPDIPATVRQKAFYNLGNTAYRQGRLEEAVEHYRRALELDPEDEDAKINLELVQRELDRRQQQNPQQQQPQPGQDGRQEPQNQEPQNQESESQKSQSQEPRDSNDPQNQENQESRSPEEPEPQQPSSEPRSGSQEPDQDGDGLPDELERTAENPTDPANPDTDGDGLQDGAEDLDADGRVDPQETDPNRRDTDGDGIPDGEEAQGSPPAGAGGMPAEALEGLTEEEALRYLMALEESPPPHKPEDARAARAGRPAKDW